MLYQYLPMNPDFFEKEASSGRVSSGADSLAPFR
jgi:hypothetical protein